jgi:hypothetical protein
MMNYCIVCIFALTGASPPLQVPQATPAYTQGYSILIKGEPAGTEKVKETIEKDGSLLAVSEHEILISDGLETKRMAFVTTMRLAKESLAPVHYSYKYTSGESGDFYEVNVKDGTITRLLSRGGRTSEATVAVQPEQVILDFSVYHQYDYLVRRYDFKKRGTQTFQNFIPLIGSNMPLQLTLVGDGKLDTPSGSIAVRNFKVEYVGLWGAVFSTDSNNRLVRLVAPGQELEVVRTDLLPAKK